jgi:hypothetical protein
VWGAGKTIYATGGWQKNRPEGAAVAFFLMMGISARRPQGCSGAWARGGMMVGGVFFWRAVWRRAAASLVAMYRRIQNESFALFTLFAVVSILAALWIPQSSPLRTQTTHEQRPHRQS